MKKPSTTMLYIVLMLSILPFTSGAQIPGATGVSISVVPAHPAPSSEVALEADNVPTQLSGATFVWSVDGKVIARGAGERRASFTTGGVGAYHTVRLQVLTQNGVSAQAEVEIPIARVTLLSDADSYIPPFYKGAALPPAGSSVWVSAFPEIADKSGVRQSRTNLVYTWKYNGAVVGSQSGYGQYAFRFTLPPRRTTVEVEVALPGEESSGFGKITITPQEPELLLYVHNPLLGPVFEHALTRTAPLQESELTLGAYPYYFSAEERGSPVLSYQWSLNRENLERTSPTLTLRKGERGGKASLSLIVEHVSTLFQEASRDITIELTQNN